MPERLDAWLPDPAVRTHHRRAARAGPDRLWACTRSVRLADTRTLGRVVRWRIPGVPAEQTFDELFRRYPFTVLEDGERHLLAGLCGRIWTLARDYPRLAGLEEFRAWDAPGTVRVLFAHWVEQAADGGAEVRSEARVVPVDRAAAMRLRALWAFIGRFERLIGAEGLTVAARRADGR